MARLKFWTIASHLPSGDRRDVSRGSNTAIFEHRTSRWGREARYLITDWGGSMGRWGSNIVTRGRWDPAGFEAQNADFVTAVCSGEGVARARARLLTVGHASGAALMAGVLHSLTTHQLEGAA